jgi:hypothetical protein
MQFLQVAQTVEGFRKLAYQDTMHLMWRWRRHLLSAKRAMHIGPGLYVNWRHLQGSPSLRGGDLKHTDKQNWGATQRIFSIETVQWLTSEMEEDPSQHNYLGTITFVWWGYQLLAAWYHDENVSPLVTIMHAASVLNSILYWRFWVDQRRKKKGQDGALEHYSIQNNFMTRETFLDTIISCATRILIFVLYRDDPDLCQWMPTGDRVSSCFCEHLNQHIRQAATNTTAVTSYSAMLHVTHYTTQQMIAATADFNHPESRRGITHTMKEGGISRTRAPDGYYDELTDENIMHTLDVAIEQGNTWLQERCKFSEDLSLDKQSHFFSAPCKHFPKMECFRHYFSVDGDASDPQGADAEGAPNKEETDDWEINDDWGGKPDDRDNVEELSDDDSAPAQENVGEIADTTECMAMFQEVLSFHQQPLEPSASNDVTWKSLCNLVSDFNHYSLSICLQQHRSLRFKNNNLFEQHREDNRHMDIWDFICINSDVVACFVVDGIKIWRIGNVEGIRKLKSEPKADTDLAACEVHSYPLKIAVTDQSAAFFVRWYRPCSVNGQVEPGTHSVEHDCLWTSKGTCAEVCQKHKEPSCNKCCREPMRGRKFLLPMNLTQTLSNEPVTEIPACIILDTVQMIKDDQHQGVWILGCGNKELILTKFADSGGIVPAPNSEKPPNKPKIRPVKKRKVPRSATPRFDAQNEEMHAQPSLKLLGRRIHIWWPQERSWFLGTVENPASNPRPAGYDGDVLHVAYDDLTCEWEQFGTSANACIWGLACDASTVAPPSPARANNQASLGVLLLLAVLLCCVACVAASCGAVPLLSH